LLGALPEQPQPLPGGRSLLFCAASRPRSAREVCEMLVERRLDPQARDSTGQTPLFLAVSRTAAGLECAKYLAEQGCQVGHRDTHGQTPLFYAAQRLDPRCVEWLIKAGSEINARDSMGQTAAFFAASSGAFQPLQALLRLRADASARDTHGQTALFHASTPSAAELLVRQGCSVNHHDSSGRSALFLAVHNGFSDVVSRLAQLACDVNGADAAGETCLFPAARADMPALCRLLVQELGADVSRRSHGGATAADHARLPQVRELLVGSAAASQRRLARKRGFAASKQEREREADVAQRRCCTIMFGDPAAPGRALLPGTPQYAAAVHELVARCPALAGWG